MSILIPAIWTWICIAFAIMLITTLIMSAQGKYLFTKDVVLRKFNIMDLQFASTGLEIVNIIKGLYLLPAEKSRKALNALRGQLYVDFVFMPAVYGGIFLLCMNVANKMSLAFGENFFAALAWLQIIPWLCDIYENIYLLNKIRPNTASAENKSHSLFRYVVAFKWGISLFAAICSIAALCYFWLSGLYSVESLPYLVIICAQLTLFFILNKVISRKLREETKE